MDPKGPFTPSDSVTVTVALTGDTFELFDGNCVGHNGLHTHFSHQCYGDGDGDGETRCEQAFSVHLGKSENESMIFFDLCSVCCLLPVIFLLGISTNVPPKEKKFGNVGIFVQFLMEINSLQSLQAE